MKRVSVCRAISAAALVVVCVFWPSVAIVQAGEITVKNDSLPDEPDFATAVGDFNQGEMAGARLTSPCDGNIVAVQIPWFEGTPGHGPTLEEAIRIYDGSTFPTPGAVLALLEGPVMTPGYMNEFRYLDEAQTIPFNVPVTNGQNFYVALEFYNPTDVGNGGPSVVRDMDGCQGGRNVLGGNIGMGWNWYNFCSLGIAGDLAIRAIVDCPDPTGACCDFEASCVNDIQAGDCLAPGDEFFVGQTCAQVTCDTPVGACCNTNGGGFNEQTQDFCENMLEFIYAGHGTTLADQVCELGSCCLPDGSCQDEIELVCIQLGGTFNGPGSDCATTNCPQPEGACCVGEICVFPATEPTCQLPWVWLGAGTDCVGDPCSAACDTGDADGDGDWDLEDFAWLQACFGGDGSGACECMDMDNDADVDSDDYGLFQPNLASSGP